MWVQSLSREDSLEEGMATHSSILAWRFPWTEELIALLSLGDKGKDIICVGGGVLEKYAVMTDRIVFLIRKQS